MYFADVIGQDSLKASLTRSVRSGHLAHAHLISGVSGGGQLPLALALAGYVFCENRGEYDRCGECPACKQVDRLGHPDLHLSFPFVKTAQTKTTEPHQRTFLAKALKDPYMTLEEWEEEITGENKKSIIPTEESRDILHKLSLKSFMGGYKVMVIWMAEKMNATAANRLLKTLEEPTAKTVVVLTAANPGFILPTIVSRTQLSRCAPLGSEEIEKALCQREGISPETARRAARFAEGSYRRAQLAATNEGYSGDAHFVLLRDWLRACVAKNLAEAMDSSSQIAKFKRDEQHRFLEYALDFLHESVMYAVLGPEKSRFEGPAADFAVKFAPYMAQKDLQGFYETLNHAHYLVTRNANPNLLFMKTSYEMMKLFSKKPAGRAA